MLQKILISACLLGDKVRYDGKAMPNSDKLLQKWFSDGRVIPVCPEVSAGMSIPRVPAEITGGDGADVLANKARVIDKDGKDVTEMFLIGANNVLSLCKKSGAKIAVLTDSSPSCGSSRIYTGDFSNTKKVGAGVTVALLKSHGIQVFSQHQLTEANKYLK